jgi:hypothetical protein
VSGIFLQILVTYNTVKTDGGFGYVLYILLHKYHVIGNLKKQKRSNKNKLERKKQYGSEQDVFLMMYTWFYVFSSY